MIIDYKGMYHERTEDAPFTGALLLALDCQIGCKGCFNQHIKNMPTLSESVGLILETVQNNCFNQGIILGGLEWSLQPKMLLSLVREAVNRHLKVMIYTGYTQKKFISKVPEILTVKGDIYIKYGPYDENQLSHEHIQYGVKLATKNQQIDTIRAFESKHHLKIKYTG